MNGTSVLTVSVDSLDLHVTWNEMKAGMYNHICYISQFNPELSHLFIFVYFCIFLHTSMILAARVLQAVFNHLCYSNHHGNKTEAESTD